MRLRLVMVGISDCHQAKLILFRVRSMSEAYMLKLRLEITITVEKERKCIWKVVDVSLSRLISNKRSV